MIDLVRELEAFHIQVDVHDPWVGPEDVRDHYGIATLHKPEIATHDAAVIAVTHEIFKTQLQDVSPVTRPKSLVYDPKHLLPRSGANPRL